MTKKKTKTQNKSEGYVGTINICNYDYDVFATNDLNKLTLNNQTCYGICNYIEQVIYISTDQHPQAQEETLVHEILHAIDYYTNSGNAKLSEEDIERLAIGLSPIIRKGLF